MIVRTVNDEAIAEAVETIRRGGTVGHATETCYGFACDIANAEAVEKLFAIKDRPREQPVSALFESIDQAKGYVEWNEKAEELAQKYLPGPLTLVLPMKQKLFPIPSGGQWLGVRISPHSVAQKLVELYGSPISTTSANLHGQPNPYSAVDIQNQYTEQDLKPDFILDSGAVPEAPASSVLKIEGDEIIVLRQGKLKI